MLHNQKTTQLKSEGYIYNFNKFDFISQQQYVFMLINVGFHKLRISKFHFRAGYIKYKAT